jgi:hypothetical protein
MWVAIAELPKSPGHPFYTLLNALLDAVDFDRFVEASARGSTRRTGRLSLAEIAFTRIPDIDEFLE